jgi:hypothetical protein
MDGFINKFLKYKARKKCFIFFLTFIFTLFALSAHSQPGKYKQVVFGCATEDLKEFEQFVVKAKNSGATHIQINAEDLPPAYWQMTPKGDPYPAWAIINHGLLKTFIPDALKKYIPGETADIISNILEERCKILRKHGLKAAFHTYEPQMLPEAVFEDNPDWRGPQVDHPVRSKTPRFAPSADHPEVLKLYTEAMKKFITRCPEVEILVFRTNDSGAGLDWGRLYNGTNGNSNFRHRSMRERIKGLFDALQKGAQEAGGTLAVHVYNTYENARDVARGLEENMAIDGFEGPAASRFSANVDDLLYYSRAFSPVAGIPRPMSFLENLERANQINAPRQFVAIVDKHNQDLYLKIYKEYCNSPTSGLIANLQFIRKIAASEVGEENADKLFDLWVALNEAQRTAQLLNVGGTIFNIGLVQQRWLVRPLVPYPSELTTEEKAYYILHQFSAGSEDEANHLMIAQGVRFWMGEGGNRFISSVLWRTRWQIGQALTLSRELAGTLEQEKKREFDLLTARLTAFDLLINNVLNTANYQLHVDQVNLALQNPNKQNIAQSFSQAHRSKMIEIARNEMDNTINLIKLLKDQENTRDIIDHAKNKDEEFVLLMGADLIEQLQKKIRIMNSRWGDYNKNFVVPNL